MHLKYHLFLYTCQLILGHTWEGVVAIPTLRFFFSFVLDDKTLALNIFSSCSFIAFAHFEQSLVMVSYYGYKI